MNWQTKKLSEICEIRIGGTPSRGVINYWKNGTLPWVSIRDMSREGKFITETKEKITEKGAKESNVKIIPKDTLLFSFKLSIGKLAFAGGDLYTNEAIAGFVIRNEKELDNNFLYYFLQSSTFDTAQHAVKGNTLNKEKMKVLEIPLPPLSEQKKIVEVLDEKMGRIAEVKKLRGEAIVDTEKIFPQTLREIFEGARKDYPVINLEEVAILVRGPFGGSLKKEIFVLRGDCVYEQGNVIDGDLENFRYFITPEKFDLMKRFSVISGDILMSCSGTIGKLVIIPKKFKKGIINQALLKITPNKKMLSKYLKFTLEDYLFKNTDHIKGMAIKNIAAVKELKKIKLPLPPLPEQQKIVKKLDELSDKIHQAVELQKSQLEDLKKLEKSYLQEAFNGKLV